MPTARKGGGQRQQQEQRPAALRAPALSQPRPGSATAQPHPRSRPPRHLVLLDGARALGAGLGVGQDPVQVLALRAVFDLRTVFFYYYFRAGQAQARGSGPAWLLDPPTQPRPNSRGRGLASRTERLSHPSPSACLPPAPAPSATSTGTRPRPPCPRANCPTPRPTTSRMHDWGRAPPTCARSRQPTQPRSRPAHQFTHTSRAPHTRGAHHPHAHGLAVHRAVRLLLAVEAEGGAAAAEDVLRRAARPVLQALHRVLAVCGRAAAAGRRGGGESRIRRGIEGVHRGARCAGAAAQLQARRGAQQTCAAAPPARPRARAGPRQRLPGHGSGSRGGGRAAGGAPGAGHQAIAFWSSTNERTANSS